MTHLHLLVTAHHRGDFAYLPRLATQLQALRQPHTLLVDTGRAWRADQWLCLATENRAPYLVMDAMGYNLIFQDGLTAEAQARLAMMMQAQLVPAPIISQVMTPAGAIHIGVGDALAFNAGILQLPRPAQGSIQQINLNLEKGQPEVQALSADTSVLPDPTISAVIEFIADEARYYQKRKGDER